jgi:Arc-like DNA binding domain
MPLPRSPSQGTEHFAVRLPAGTRARMKEVADAEMRTMSNWAQKVLLEALDAEEQRRREARQ